MSSCRATNAERIARLACAAADVRDEAIRTRDEAVAELQRLRAEHAAALATARREGAEGMREAVKRVLVLHRAVREGREEALRAEGVPQGDCAFLCLATAVVSLDRVMREVEALPLPGDAMGGEP